MRTGSSRRAPLLLLAVAILAGFGFAAWSALRTGPPPQIEIAPERPAIGRRTAVEVTVTGQKSDLARVRVELLQADRVEKLAEKSFPWPSAWTPWKAGSRGDKEQVTVGREVQPNLQAGEATLRVTVDRAAGWLRFPAPTVRELKLPVRLSPPRLEVTSIQTYVAQGGCEAVVYRVGESAVRDGVVAGDAFFPGYPLPGGGPRDRFALFAVPYDLADSTRVKLAAFDDAGNEAQVAFIDRFTPRPAKSDRIELTPTFMEKVVPEILSQTPGLTDKGDLLQNYLEINGELRRKNAQELLDLAAQTKHEFLWSEPFAPFPNGKVMSSFADRRTYYAAGREVDHQDHLGFDLASVKGAPVPSANRGIVVLARYFGIFGNTVIVDHGYGLMSLYAHLSAIGVQPGQTVERGAVLGQSGQTGLAGGDHLHFTFLLAGHPVTPVEWWDPHWIRDRIARKLGAALPFKGEGVPAAAPSAPARRASKKPSRRH